MKKYILIGIIFILSQCTSPVQDITPKIVYIYDSDLSLKTWKMDDSLWQSIVFETDIHMPRYYDSILISNNRKIYRLEHFYLYEGYNDTSFLKSKIYLDSINYVDNNWLLNEEKLDSFWQPVNCWRCGGIYDTAQIYLIHPVENTDSVIFMQVHREYFQTQ